MLEANIKIINDKINKKCSEIGRDKNDILVVAVSKTKPLEHILEANKLGLTNFGENKAQELKQKSILDNKDIKWHFIGHLQTNKVKDVVNVTHLIHSVDTIKLAKEINKRAGNINKIQNILIEINTSDEESKYGLQDFQEILNLVEFCKLAPNINLKGLMTMAPFIDDENIIRKSFKSLKDIFIKLNKDGFNLVDLSMGMTNDFEIAIEEGATILRIGTAIFGSR